MNTSTNQPPLRGVAALSRQAFEGKDLTGLAVSLIQRLETAPGEANSQMDLATIFMLKGNPEFALAHQRQALAQQQLYHIPAARAGGPRLLALMAPGDLMTNTPLPFLLEDGDIALDMLYVGGGLALPDEVPDHDVLFNAIGDSEQTNGLLAALAPHLATWPRPVLNRPAAVHHTARENAYKVLSDIPGLVMPPSARAGREALARVASGDAPVASLLGSGEFPLIIRPLDSHAGRALAKLESRDDLAAYLAALPGDDFYVSFFYDYRSPDGLFRKYRVAIIQGRSYAVHMGISSHWIIHYLNADMDRSEAKRAEEAAWMTSYATGFGTRHAGALAAIATHTGLDYVVIDCAETPDWELLVFEIDTGAIVHAMDPVDMFPYKQPAMHTLFDGFRDMIRRTARQSPA